MTLVDWEVSTQLVAQQPTVHALVMAAMRVADPQSRAILKSTWPHVWDELEARINSPTGLLPGDGEPGTVACTPIPESRPRGRHRAVGQPDLPPARANQQETPWFAASKETTDA